MIALSVSEFNIYPVSESEPNLVQLNPHYHLKTLYNEPFGKSLRQFKLGKNVRILIAEDTKAGQLFLSHLLTKWGHEVFIAADGKVAWDILQKEEFNMVISDWMMPSMNGVELCQRIRSADFSNYVYIILVTAFDSKSGVITGMDAGADDYLSKPFNSDELRVRVQAGVRILKLEGALIERNRMLVHAYATMRLNLEAASRLQMSLLPPPSVSLANLHFDWLFLPSTFVAGDIFNYFHILNQKYVAFYQLDVSGHGVPAAMLAYTLSNLLTPENFLLNQIETSDSSDAAEVMPKSPKQVVTELNKRFQNENESSLYFTMVYCILNTSTGELQFCQAGHPSPIVLKKGQGIRIEGDGGFPIGMLPDLEYQSQVLNLQSGDRFCLYSDGVTECANIATGKQFGKARLMRFLDETASMPLNQLSIKLKQQLSKWRGGETFEDDVTFLVVEVG